MWKDENKELPKRISGILFETEGVDDWRNASLWYI